jgi:hypothetical protein
MRNPKLILSTAAVGLLLSGFSHAQSLADGIYLSGGDDAGKGKCTLTFKSTDTTNK